jgi:hypothetical protein
MAVVVEARCVCRRVVGTVEWESGHLEWEPAVITGADGVEVEVDEDGIAHAFGSSRAMARAEMMAAIDSANYYGERDGPPESTPARSIDDAGDVLHGWCPDHGAVPLSRGMLLAAARKAQRSGRVRRVVAQRS